MLDAKSLNEGRFFPVERATPNHFEKMKIRQQATEGQSRELLLKEYFLNAYLIALLKQVGTGMRRRSEEENEEWAQRIAEQN
ncbi:MAG: hypothetical protein CMO40_05945 [Verrucomicrobiaceae bacterium]|nr:hypothetical protein [Verrucomicrobiaceae bacterium]